MSPRDVASVLWALSQAPPQLLQRQQQQQPELLCTLADASARTLGRANAQDLAMSLVGLAKSGGGRGLLGDEWMEGFEARVAQVGCRG